MTLQQVFDRYHEHHARALPSGRDQERHLRFWREFFGSGATVANVPPARQHAFVEHLKGRGLQPGTIKRILASGAASLGWSYRRGELLALPISSRCPTANPGSACSRPRRSWRCGGRAGTDCSSCGVTS